MLGVGCQKLSKDEVPINNTEPENGQVAYNVCKDVTTDKRVYTWGRCGIDTCQESFYDQDGKVTEVVGGGDGSMINTPEPKTKVKDCILTTKEYFEKNIIDKNTLPK